MEGPDPRALKKQKVEGKVGIDVDSQGKPLSNEEKGFMEIMAGQDWKNAFALGLIKVDFIAIEKIKNPKIDSIEELEGKINEIKGIVSKDLDRENIKTVLALDVDETLLRTIATWGNTEYQFAFCPDIKRTYSEFTESLDKGREFLDKRSSETPIFIDKKEYVPLEDGMSEIIKEISKKVDFICAVSSLDGNESKENAVKNIGISKYLMKSGVKKGQLVPQLIKDEGLKDIDLIILLDNSEDSMEGFYSMSKADLKGVGNSKVYLAGIRSDTYLNLLKKNQLIVKKELLQWMEQYEEYLKSESDTDSDG